MGVLFTLCVSLVLVYLSGAFVWWEEKRVALPEPFLDAFQFFHDKMRRVGDGGVGLYYDHYSLPDNQGNNGAISIGSTGFGMVTVCIGNAVGLISNEEAVRLTSETLDALLGKVEGFVPTRSPNGFFAHFINPENGTAEKNSEISTVDTALLAAGAMFARNYLKDPTVTEKVNELVQGIEWRAAVAKDEWLYMKIDPDSGQGVPTPLTKPFNEYFILAYVGKVVEQETNQSSNATAYFDKYYSNPPASLEAATATPNTYWRYGPLWSDRGKGHFASSFEIQFCYYMTSFFPRNSYYSNFMNQSAGADWLYFRNVFKNSKYANVVTTEAPYQWGCGAGAYPPANGYKATAIENDSELVYSAPIIAGFFPADEFLRSQELTFIPISDTLDHLYTNKVCTYEVDGKTILWRRSLEEKQWRAEAIQSVDFSTLLLGYAWKLLGKDFFLQNAI